MTTASPPEDYIYKGVWTNFLRGGKVFGTTLTVSPDVASVLSPALALLISIAGSQLWRLFQFALHQTRATQREKNFLFHQQQVTLRNTTTDLNTLWRLLRLAFAWRRHTDVKVCWESLPLLLWTSIHLTLVILFGLFSSWLLEAHDDVLSRSPWCGQYSQDFINTVYGRDRTDAIYAEALAYNNYKNSRFAVAQQHVDVCQTSFEGCDVFVTNALPYQKTVTSGSCPFSESICHPNSSTLEFNTGYLSSARHLGLNAPEDERVSFRLEMKCAPLDDARHATGWQLVNASSDLPAHQVSDAHYGAGTTSGILRNATFSYSKPVMECAQENIFLPYVLDSVYSLAGVKYQTFDPIPELWSNDTDISLIMLMSNCRYFSPVIDPFFNAELPANISNPFCAGGSEVLYTRERPLTTIGCTQQWQVCSTDSGPKAGDIGCTPLGGIYQVQEAFATSSDFTASYNAQQLVTVDRIVNTTRSSTLSYLIQGLAQTTGPPIKARDLITGTVGMSVPDAQWQIEVEYWMQSLLASIQQSSMDSSTGQFAFDTHYIEKTTPASDDTGTAYRLCQNQIIHSTSYRNFNFFALLLCVILCLIITVLGLTIEDIIGYIRQQRLENSDCRSKKDMWFINSDLEMLRTITELKKKLRWSRSSFGIPFAPVGAKAVLDDLKSDDFDEDYEMKVTSQGRRRNASAATLSLERRRAHGYGVHHHTKSCTTCESFEMVSTASQSSLPKPTSTDQEQNFYYANAVPTQRQHSTIFSSPKDAYTAVLGSDNHVRPNIQPLQPSQTQDQNGYNFNVSRATSSFQYSDTIPSSDDETMDSVEEQRSKGYPVLNLNSSTPANHSHIGLGLGSSRTIDTAVVGNDIGEGKSRRNWLWSKEKDTRGTIC